MVTPKPDKPDKIVPDGARPKNGWFYLASWTRSFQETWRKWPRLCQTTTKLPFVYKKDRIWCCLAQSGQLVSSFLQTSGAGSQIEPAIFRSGSVWDDFVWLVWFWCNGLVTPTPARPDQIVARRSQTKKWLVPSGFLHHEFSGNMKEVGQIVPDNTRFCLFL